LILICATASVGVSRVSRSACLRDGLLDPLFGLLIEGHDGIYDLGGQRLIRKS